MRMKPKIIGIRESKKPRVKRTVPSLGTIRQEIRKNIIYDDWQRNGATKLCHLTPHISLKNSQFWKLVVSRIVTYDWKGL